MEVARLVNDEENGCKFEAQTEDPGWLISVRERLLEGVCVTRVSLLLQ